MYLVIKQIDTVHIIFIGPTPKISPTSSRPLVCVCMYSIMCAYWMYVYECMFVFQEFLTAVEAKQVAQQDSERAKYIVERAIQEKRAIIIKAAGEAKSAELIGNVRYFYFRLLILID